MSRPAPYDSAMAAYDYRCRTCDTTFEVHRGMTAPADDVRCPEGHADVTRVYRAVALAGRAAGSAVVPAQPSGGCCGGGCCG